MSWTKNLLIMGKCKRSQEREFYLRLAADRRWSKRELERQIDACLFERAILNPPKVSAVLTQLHPDAASIFSKKPHERPSIGVLLCATKDNEVVEYALSRSLSPALIAEYQTALPDKQLLQRKLHEFYQLAMPAEAAPNTKSRKARQP